MAELVTYKVKKAFHSYAQGATVQLREEDARELLEKGLIEEIRNKKAGAASLKNLLFLAAIVFCAAFARPALAADALVAISTFPVTEAETLAPQVPGAAKIEKLVISNSSSTPVAVTVYKDCVSTTAVSGLLRVAVPANGNVILDYSNYNLPLAHSNVCIRKSDAVENVYAAFHYR